MKQEAGYEWLDDVSDEVRDMYCKSAIASRSMR